MEKQKKIDVAIRDTKLKLEKVKHDIMLLIREEETLHKMINTLEIIQDNKDFE